MNYSKPKFKEKYGNFINGKFEAPEDGEYFENHSPIDNKLLSKYPRSKESDVKKAIEAANNAKDAWGKTSVTERSTILNKIA
ncbi:MAG TPA: aldehyde dehydrogenase family protein, partial [Gillisia sp.]|nr:aldehyde dehydrogenase family protein [Gillisia sp.]